MKTKGKPLRTKAEKLAYSRGYASGLKTVARSLVAEASSLLWQAKQVVKVVPETPARLVPSLDPKLEWIFDRRPNGQILLRITGPELTKGQMDAVEKFISDAIKAFPPSSSHPEYMI